MTLLDRFRQQPRQKHADPTVRLAYVAELPLTERDQIVAIAREDEDSRVRRAAVAKLMDPAALATVAATDADPAVRSDAVAMLRDIALDAFEGVTESESLAAVNALDDPKTLAQIAKTSLREDVGRQALTRIADTHAVASVARQAALEPIRVAAFERLESRDDILSVAINCEFRDTALAAVEKLSARTDLEQVAARAKNKSAAKRARAIVRDIDSPAEPSSPLSGELEPVEEPAVQVETVPEQEAAPDRTEEMLRARQEEEAAAAREAQESAERARAEAAERDARAIAATREAEWRQSRLGELAVEADSAAADVDLSAARRRISIVRREWTDVAAGVEVDAEVAGRLTLAEARIGERDAKANETENRTRREALNRINQLLARAEPLADKPDVSLKAAERALRELRSTAAAIPPLPSRQDFEDVSRRLKAAQAALTPKVNELRDAADWRRWANVGIQEQLCTKMEALKSVEDADEVVRRIRDLQAQWREAADVPRAQGEILWRRFKTAHDELWARCETYFAAQAEARGRNLALKIELCERVEALADSTQWLETAEAIKRAQAEWKNIGPVTRGQEKAVWERFRSACDRFFTRRHDDLVKRKAMWAENLAKKEALCARVEALVDSTDWERAAAEIRRLQAEWKTIGPVKKSRSDAIWQRFRGASDQFFTRYTQRHDLARGERIAAREAICAELESLAETPLEGAPADEASAAAPQDVLAKARSIRSRWQQEVSTRAIDRERGATLDARFADAFARVVARWPAAFAGSDLDPDANRKRMDALVKRMEDLAASLAGPESLTDGTLASTTRLAERLKEALAANTIRGKVDVDSRRRAAQEEMRHAQATWSRIGPVPDNERRLLADRFQRAIRRIAEGGEPGRAG